MIGSAKALFGIVAASFWILVPAHASTITVGLPAESADGNCLPFSCPLGYGLTTFQQVYANTAFPAAVDISGIEFFDTQLFNGQTTLAGGSYTLDLSVTSQAVGNLDLTSPANNVGIDSKLFFSGSLPSITNKDLIFSGTPYAYNPAAGNLLLTVTFSGVSDPPTSAFIDQASSGSATTFASFTSGGNYQENGLVTEFTASTSVPEPSTLLLVTMLCGWFYLARRLRVKD
jgi:hypothetical protein